MSAITSPLFLLFSSILTGCFSEEKAEESEENENDNSLDGNLSVDTSENTGDCE